MTSDATTGLPTATLHRPHPRPPSAGGAMLRILHSRGVPCEGAVPLRPEGRGVSDALALGDPRLMDALWRDANRCRIAWRSEGWTLSNESQLLVCALNGCRVKSGEGAVLRVGHVLELGLARFLVDEARLADADADADAEAVCDPALGSLAPPVDLTGDRSAPSLFGQQATGGAAGFTSASGLSEGSESTRTSSSGSAGLSIDWEHLAPAADVFPAPVAAARRAGVDTEPLASLHEEYLRVARDPSQLAGRSDWGGFTASPADSAPTLAGLSEQAGVYATLRDIVLRREGIDEIIDAFDPGIDVEPVAAIPGMPGMPGMAEVLRLFMPIRAQAAPALAPSLTRREHHALSPDSPMPISAARAVGSGVAQQAASRAPAEHGAPHDLDD